jgi:hypothetical protein
LYGIPEAQTQALVHGVQQSVSVKRSRRRKYVFAAGVFVFDFIVEQEMQIFGLSMQEVG